MSSAEMRIGRRRPVLLIFLIVLIVALGVNAYIIRTGQLDDQKQDTTAAVQGQKVAADEGQSLADEVLSACAAGGDDASALSAAGLCGKATTTKENIDQSVRDTPSAPSSTTNTTIVRREVLPVSTIIDVIREVINDVLVSSCGADGCRDGKDSTVPGPQSTVPGPSGAQGGKGDTPSDETLLALIRRVFAANPPADGVNGTNGTNGRGIAALACSGGLTPMTFTVTYDDGTQQEFTCGEIPIPTPTPDEPSEETP